MACAKVASNCAIGVIVLSVPVQESLAPMSTVT